MNKMMVHAILMIGLPVVLSVGAQGQEPAVPSKIEVGVQFSSLTATSQSQQGGGLSATGTGKKAAAGFGGRFTFNLTKHLALEAEGNFFPHEDSSDFSNGGRLLQGQFGVKAGKRYRKFGIFGKARPGLVSSSRVYAQVGTITVDINGQPVTGPLIGLRRKTSFSMDLGGVVEFYPSRKILTRIDVGDTIIHDKSSSFILSGLGVVPVSRTSHNLQLSAGIGFRFGSVQPDQTTTPDHEERKRRFEVGAQFSSLSFTEVEHFVTFPPFLPPPDFRDTRSQAGFGARFTYNLTSHFALETQADFFPRDTTLFNNARAGGRTLQGQAGIKIGKRFESFGIFGKARPGAVSFSKTLEFVGVDNSPGFPFPIFHLRRRTYFSLDLGGVLEFYPSPRIVARFDGGDTMIRYRRMELPSFTGSLVTPAETLHNFQFSAGVGFRF